MNTQGCEQGYAEHRRWLQVFQFSSLDFDQVFTVLKVPILCTCSWYHRNARATHFLKVQPLHNL